MMNIYFSGIGGVGIGPLAEIARDAGYDVQGSDARASSITRELKESGIQISTDQTGMFLDACHQKKPLDWFVHTAALPSDHPELLRARELGLRIAKRDELLSAIIADKGLQLIAIAGTHGKTTTTGMTVWTMQQLGIPVSYSVGTTLSFGPSGHYEPGSRYFVYECDEFDRNFLAFSPHLSLTHPSVNIAGAHAEDELAGSAGLNDVPPQLVVHVGVRHRFFVYQPLGKFLRLQDWQTLVFA